VKVEAGVKICLSECRVKAFAELLSQVVVTSVELPG
jgi:hypothetical protein